MKNLKQLIKEFRESHESDDNLDFAEMCVMNLPKLLDAMEVLVEAVEFYAEGAGLDLVDEGRNFSVDYVAYENDFRRDTPLHLDQPIGEYARKALKKIEEKVSGA